MAKTFNRQPIQVGYPSNADVKDYFFNHYEWKGINDDKNFLEVDQHTFNDAKNVYMDSESLLRSRPSMKRVPSDLYNSSGSTVIASLQNILDFWVFGDYVVYYCQNITVNGTSYSYVLLFTKKVGDNTHIIALSEDLSTLSAEFEESEVKLILSKRKIFVFTKYSLSYFDFDTEAYYNSTDDEYVNPIYVPVTKSITPNVETAVDSPNILTNQEIYVYLYNSEFGVNVDIYDKTVVFELNGIKYSMVFTKSTSMILVENLLYVDFNYDRNTDYTDPVNSTNVKSRRINMAVSKNNSIAIFSETSRMLMLSVSDGVYDYYTFPAAAGNIALPVNFSKDGSLVYIVTDSSLWWLSVYADTSTGVKKYDAFTDASVAYSNFINWAGQDADVLAACVIGDGDMCVYYRYYDSFDSKWNYMLALFENDTLHVDDLNLNGGWVGEYLAPDAASVSYGSVVLDYNFTQLKFKADGNDVTSIINVTISCYSNSAIIFYDSNYTTYIIGLYNPLVQKNSLLIFSDKTLYIFFATRYGTDDTNSGVNIQRGYVDFSGFTDGIVNLGNKLNYASQNVYDANIFHSIDSMTANTVYIPNEVFYHSRMFMYAGSDNIVVSMVGIFEFSSKVYTPFIVTDDLDCVTIVGVTDHIYYYAGYMSYVNPSDPEPDPTLVYTTDIKTTIELKYTKITKYDNNDQPVLYNFIVPDYHTELRNFYFAIDNYVMISSSKTDDNNNWQWYFPENQKQNFNYKLTGVHPISDSVVAVFMKDEIDYIAYDTEAKAYTYQKSKLQVGLPEGNNVITSLDGTTILFVTKRGLVGLGYQDFIASTEQALSYLSDSIFQIFNDWNNTAIRLHLHGFWLICYKQTTGDVWIYDIRNKSWWYCEYKNHVATKFATDGTELLCLASNILFDFDRSDNDYYDDDGTYQLIDWQITSQKLYLNAANYYKHIVNITLGIALDTIASNNQVTPTMNLEICNYRKIRNVVDSENFSYSVDMIRTFVHRLNYFKVCEFQYRLSSDSENVTQVPLSLANVTVKYKIAGEVR